MSSNNDCYHLDLLKLRGGRYLEVNGTICSGVFRLLALRRSSESAFESATTRLADVAELDISLNAVELELLCQFFVVDARRSWPLSTEVVSVGNRGIEAGWVRKIGEGGRL